LRDRAGEVGVLRGRVKGADEGGFHGDLRELLLQIRRAGAKLQGAWYLSGISRGEASDGDERSGAGTVRWNAG
jgi:hypothetical protein